MKVLILGDSLALPREEVGGGKLLEATYPYLLEHSLRRRFGGEAPMVIERGMRRRTIEYVLDDWTEQVELKKPEVVIVHVGVVDCAPRVFLRREHAFVARMRFKRLRDRILKFAHDHRRAIILRRKREYVPLPRFKRLVKDVVQRAQLANVSSLLFVTIIKPPDSLEFRSPGFQRNVDLYNEVLKAQTKHPNVSVVDVNRLLQLHGGSENLTIDGIHLNEQGHSLLAGEIEDHVVSVFEKETMAATKTARGTEVLAQ